MLVMPDPLKIDVHMHLYETKEAGEREKAAYEIWEYGPKPDIRFSRFGGDVDDALTAMREAGFAHAVVANLFALSLLDEATRAAGPDAHAERLVAGNRWACALSVRHPQLTAFVAADPLVLGGEAGARHLREMVERHGARGIKIHPVAQGFMPDDPRMEASYRTCEELSLAVLSHSGSDKVGTGFAVPASFASVLQAFPKLTLILAHLGGASWRQTADLAGAFPEVAFDLCEIIEWTGAPNAPSMLDLARLIHDVGPERVMLGTDFPWYDLDRTVELVMDLPILSTEEREAILGANAARILRLPV
jgi:predicted TIM-barrel fold metal-dependent hydrolase